MSMPRIAGFFLAVLLLAVTAPAPAQQSGPDDPPKVLVPKNADPKARDRRAALYRFMDGTACVREDRLLEALKAFQDAVELDPEPAAPYKAQLPLLIALERGTDAVATCRAVLQRNPDDYEVWAILGRLYKAMAQYPAARQALEKGLKAAGLEDRPELAQQINYDLGALYESDNQFGPAADAYTRAACLLDHPDVIAEHAGIGKELVVERAAEIYERIGDLYRKAKKHEQAVAAYVKAQQRAPARAERLNYNLAQICRDQGDSAKALTYLDAYLRSQPIGMEAYEMKMALLESQGKEAAIVPWLEEAAKRDAYNVGLHLLLARACGQAKQTARAEQVYTTLAQSSPSPELYRGLLRLYHTEPARMLALVEQTLRRATRKDEPDAIAVAQAKAIVGALRDDTELAQVIASSAAAALGKGTALTFETTQVFAVFADKNRQYAEAEKLYRGCLRQMPPEAETMVYGGLIRVLAKARKYADQLDVCDGALEGKSARGLPKAQATSQVLFLTEKARALAGLQRFDDAVKAADRALLVAGDNHKLLVRHLRVRLLSAANRFDEAEKECHALLKDYPQPAETLEIRYVLSTVYAQAKAPAKSEEQLKLILKADPDSPAANNDLGYLWADQNRNLGQAEQMIRRAIEADRRLRSGTTGPAVPGEPAPPSPVVPASAIAVEDNAAYIDSLGWVLYRRGHIDEARQELERAASLPDGEDPVIWEHLGDVYSHLRRPADARRAWERAVRLYEQGERRRDEERLGDLLHKLQSVR
jgi:tetratricopeptide (TPR) repeat protein